MNLLPNLITDVRVMREKSVKEAEAKVRAALCELETATGLCPLRVWVTPIDVTDISDKSKRYVMGDVTIELEHI